MAWRDQIDGVIKACRNTFGETVQYCPGGTSCVSITAIFDNEALTVDPETHAVIATNQPRLGVRLSDLPSDPAQGDIVTRNGISYRVVDCEEDSWGHAKLLLLKV